jgi:hypothetical protein
VVKQKRGGEMSDIPQRWLEVWRTEVTNGPKEIREIRLIHG